jgi:hypothetical protein
MYHTHKPVDVAVFVAGPHVTFAIDGKVAHREQYDFTPTPTDIQVAVEETLSAMMVPLKVLRVLELEGESFKLKVKI